MVKPSWTTLAESAEVIAGAAVGGDWKPEVPVLVAKDVGSTLPPLAALRRSPVPEGARRDRATVRAGDVVVVAKGSAPRAGLVSLDTAGAVASGNLLVLRPGTQVDSAMVAAFLNTTEGQRRLVAVQTGTTIPSLSVGALGRVAVPLLAMERQRRLGAFASAAERLLATEQRLLELRRELLGQILESAFASESLDELAGLEVA